MSTVADWNGRPVRELEDDHLLNAEVRCQEILDDIEGKLDDCEEWQTQKQENLEQRQEEWQCSLLALQDEIQRRGLTSKL
jgi:hypothetical protein